MSVSDSKTSVSLPQRNGRGFHQRVFFLMLVRRLPGAERPFRRGKEEPHDGGAPVRGMTRVASNHGNRKSPCLSSWGERRGLRAFTPILSPARGFSVRHLPRSPRFQGLAPRKRRRPPAARPENDTVPPIIFYAGTKNARIIYFSYLSNFI